MQYSYDSMVKKIIQYDPETRSIKRREEKLYQRQKWIYRDQIELLGYKIKNEVFREQMEVQYNR